MTEPSPDELKKLHRACQMVRESVDRLYGQPYSPPVGKLMAAAEILAAAVQRYSQERSKQ